MMHKLSIIHGHKFKRRKLMPSYKTLFKKKLKILHRIDHDIFNVSNDLLINL